MTFTIEEISFRVDKADVLFEESLSNRAKEKTQGWQVPAMPNIPVLVEDPNSQRFNCKSGYISNNSLVIINSEYLCCKAMKKFYPSKLAFIGTWPFPRLKSEAGDPKAVCAKIVTKRFENIIEKLATIGPGVLAGFCVFELLKAKYSDYVANDETVFMFSHLFCLLCLLKTNMIPIDYARKVLYILYLCANLLQAYQVADGSYVFSICRAVLAWVALLI